MGVCTEKPDILLDLICLEAVGEQQRRDRTVVTVTSPPSKMMTEEISAMTKPPTSNTATGSGMPFDRSAPKVRTSNEDGSPKNRTRSKRGGERNTKSKKVHAADEVNEWATSLESVAPVTALLDELTMEKFDSISDQIIEWANKSETETDGRTLIHIVRLVYEKATNEAVQPEIYARLCRKMVERISSNIKDDGIRSTDGRHITGGQLFRKYLLNRCQEDSKRAWAVKNPTAAEVPGGVEFYLDANRAAQRAKQQGLGLIQFIGELYKLQMLTERVMHEYIKKLLGNINNPKEEEIAALCRLLKNVGKLLDSPKSRAHMNIYFTKLGEIGRNSNVTPHLQAMLRVGFAICF